MSLCLLRFSTTTTKQYFIHLTFLYLIKKFQLLKNFKSLSLTCNRAKNKTVRLRTKSNCFNKINFLILILFSLQKCMIRFFSMLFQNLPFHVTRFILNSSEISSFFSRPTIFYKFINLYLKVRARD